MWHQSDRAGGPEHGQEPPQGHGQRRNQAQCLGAGTRPQCQVQAHQGWRTFGQKWGTEGPMQGSGGRLGTPMGLIEGIGDQEIRAKNKLNLKKDAYF